MRRRTPVAIALLTGLAWMPAGGCSSPDREYDTSGGTGSGGAPAQGGKAASGGKIGTGGAKSMGGEAGAAGMSVVPQAGAGGALSEGGAGGVPIVEGGAGGHVGSGGTVGTAGEGGVGGSSSGVCTFGDKMCTGDVPALCSSAGTWVDQTPCSRTVQNASALCVNGACDYSSCGGSYQDCDTIRANGCESNKNTDSLNCGGCGRDCARLTQNTVAPACNGAGACDYTSCAANYQDCDANRANGCESNKNTDSANCGGCGKSCATSIKNAKEPVCNGAGSCDYSACAANYQDCDTIRANGCESDKTTDLANCGGCGRNCTALIKNAAGPTCAAGACDYTGACTAGYLDCNGTRTDGCERPPTAGQAGWPVAFASSGSFSPNYLLGHQITVPCSILAGWGVVAKGTGQHLVLALYRDVGGVPGALVTSSPVITTNSATVTTVTAPATSQVALAAGTYWLMGVWDVSATPSQDQGGAAQQIDYISFTYGGALPATFPTPTTYQGTRFNYFLNLQ